MSREEAVAILQSDLATVKEFAGLARQTPEAVYKRIARAQQPGVVRVGGVIRIDLAIALSGALSKVS